MSQAQQADDLGALYARGVQALATMARDDFAAFAECVLRDEATGKPVSLAGYHVEWADLLDAHPRLVLWSHLESAKTTLIGVGRTLWTLGRDPSARCLMLSNTHGQALKVVRAVANYIERSEQLREVFPELRPGRPWSPDSGSVTVDRPHVSKDPSIQAQGLGGNVLGSRLDLVIADDVLDFENVRTPEARAKTAEWFQATVMSRLTAEARVVVMGTAWHPDDLLYRLASGKGWKSGRYGVANEDGVPRWPERWPAARIAKTREELGPLDAARQLDCVARDDADASFKEQWLQQALARGADKRLLPHLLNLPAGYRTVTGVDLGVGTTRKHDETAIATLLLYPNHDRELISLEAGRWKSPEIIRRVIQAHQRFQSTVVVETVAAQAYIRDQVRAVSAMPIIGYTTGRGEKSLQWQAERLSSELDSGKWIFPSEHGKPTGEVATLIRDLLYYSPAAHTPDRVAALLLARWAADKGARKVESFHLDLDRR